MSLESRSWGNASRSRKTFERIPESRISHKVSEPDPNPTTPKPDKTDQWLGDYESLQELVSGLPWNEVHAKGRDFHINIGEIIRLSNDSGGS